MSEREFFHSSAARMRGEQPQRYVSLTFTMPAPPIDAALAKVGIDAPCGPGDDDSTKRFGLLELE